MLSGSTDTPVSGDNVDSGSSEDASLSSNDLNELWKSPSPGNNWFVLGHENLFFVPGYNRDGISIDGRKYDTGNVGFESETMKKGYNPTAIINHMGDIYVAAETTTDGNNAILYGFDRSDGSILFRFETPSDGKHTRIPEISKIDDGPVIFGADSAGMGENQEPLLYAVDPEDGTEQWRIAPEPREGFINGLITTDGSVYSMIQSLRVYDAETGQLQHQEDDLNGFFGMSYARGKIITAGDTIQAYDTVNQEIAWETSSPGGNVENPLTPTDAVLYGATETGYVFALDSSSGDTIWTSRIDGSVTQRSPVVLGATVWVSADNGEVSILMRGNGKEAFSIAPPTAGDNRSRPLEVLNDAVYIGGNNPVTYTLDTLSSN
jgi:outer membrane protein assembly factor BamB